MVVFKVNSHGCFFDHKFDQLVLKMKFFIYFLKQKDNHNDDCLQGQFSWMVFLPQSWPNGLENEILHLFLKAKRPSRWWWWSSRPIVKDVFWPQIWPIVLENENLHLFLKMKRPSRWWWWSSRPILMDVFFTTNLTNWSWKWNSPLKTKRPPRLWWWS